MGACAEIGLSGRGQSREALKRSRMRCWRSWKTGSDGSKRSQQSTITAGTMKYCIMVWVETRENDQIFMWRSICLLHSGSVSG